MVVGNIPETVRKSELVEPWVSLIPAFVLALSVAYEGKIRESSQNSYEKLHYPKRAHNKKQIQR